MHRGRLVETRLWLLRVALLAGASACGTERAPPLQDFGLGAEREYPGCEDIAFDSCYVNDAECRQLVFDAVSCARGVDLREAPDVELVTYDELGPILDAEVAADPSSQPDERTLDALVRIGALDPVATESDGTEASQGGIAGLYLPRSDRVILVQLEEAEIWPVVAVVVLVHEFTHYLQARDFDWEEAWPKAESFDEQMALISTIEGEASVYENSVGAVFAGVAHDTRFTTDSLQLKVEAANAVVAEFGVPYGYARSVFPYYHGFVYAARAWRSDGPEGVSALLDDPPQSTREMMTPSEPFPRSNVVDVELPDSPEGWSLVSEDTLGAFVLFGMAAGAIYDKSKPDNWEKAWDNALGWRGDRFGAYESGDDVVGVWRLEFDTEEIATSVSEELGRVVTNPGSLLVRTNGKVVTAFGYTSNSITEEWEPFLD